MTIDELVLDPEQKNYWDFEVLPNVNFKNCNRIHPLKQLELQKLIDASAYDKGIDAIVVFGSATQFRCNSKSDIDMVIFRNDNKKYYPDAFDATTSELDVFFEVGDRLKKILYEYGVIVYRRAA